MAAAAIPTLKPGDARALAELIADARRERAPLEVTGGGALRGVGGAVEAAASLDLSALDAVAAYEPDELVLTIGAGAAMEDIEAMLAAHGQHLAFEPPDFRGVLKAGGRLTLGGALASNFGGPRRIKDGGPRDHFLGFEAVGGDAVAFKAGGRVVKNVTGFDLPKLLAGSWGTLAVMTAVTVKVLPRPQTGATLAIAGLDEAASTALMNRALGWPLEISAAARLEARAAAALIGGEAGASATLLRLEGFSPSVQDRAGMLRERLDGVAPIRLIEAEASEALWRAIRDATPFADDPRTLWRMNVPAASAARAVAAIRERTALEALYDWGGALVWLAVDGEDSGLIPKTARDHGGHAAPFRASPALRRSAGLFSDPSPIRARLEANLRARFDPDGVLNPGRLGPAAVETR
jgi:glycolate oxidase FAD binding subunit